jgi:translation elongation factor EF-G
MSLPELLRVVLTDPSEAFQLRFAKDAAAQLGHISGVRLEASGSGLTISSGLERDISAAIAAARVTRPTVRSSETSVLYSADSDAPDPWYRVRVRTPEDYFGDVVYDLNRRGGEIQTMDDGEAGSKVVTALAPVAGMIGYDQALAKLSRGHASAEFEFGGYRGVRPRPFSPSRA